MKKNRTLEAPGLNDERELDSIVSDKADTVTVRGRVWRVKWLRNEAKRKVTGIMLNEKDEMKVTAKCAAALRLNGFFKIRLFWWLLWRWFYYVMQYSDEELTPFIEMCKKKVQLTEYFVATILLTEMKDTMMTMRREEVERIRQESIGAQRGTSGKSTNA